MTPEEAQKFKVQFISTSLGLTVKFKNLSENVPTDIDPTLYSWDFGDGTTETNKPTQATHTYAVPGLYKVILSISGSVGSDVVLFKSEKTIIISDITKTHLPDTIYRLIQTYIPADIFGEVPLDERYIFINKWQLFLQPLVNHEIPLEEYDNEDYYEALENQLIMQLAAYDWMLVTIQNAIAGQATGSISSTTIEESTGTGTPVPVTSDGVKRITTGPVEVEYFDNKGEGDSKKVSNVIASIKPGGVLDMLKQSICMLSERLEIYLSICRDLRTITPPKVVNHRKTGPLSGPDPIYPVL